MDIKEYIFEIRVKHEKKHTEIFNKYQNCSNENDLSYLRTKMRMEIDFINDIDKILNQLGK